MAELSPKPQTTEEELTLSLSAEPEEIEALVGPADSHLRIIQQRTTARVLVRGSRVEVHGPGQAAQLAHAALRALLEAIRRGRRPSTADVKYVLRILREDPTADLRVLVTEPVVITHRGRPIYPKTRGQAEYVQAMREYDVVFCFGPAGTGKTYMAMAQAVADLRDGRVARIVLSRPIVEAGEHLGFLPGDIAEKVDPYLRPLHDALQDIMGAERFRKHLERGTIEVVPLAYMRGRTINDAFMVLDEAQNATPGQVKMFLTRMGFGSKVVVTGDITQTDLPVGQESGLRHAMRVLADLDGVAFVELTGRDIVRHDLVQRIVSAYEESERHGQHSQPQQARGGADRPAGGRDADE